MAGICKFACYGCRLRCPPIVGQPLVSYEIIPGVVLQVDVGRVGAGFRNVVMIMPALRYREWSVDSIQWIPFFSAASSQGKHLIIRPAHATGRPTGYAAWLD